MKKIRIFGAALVAALWLGLSLFAWMKPAGDISEAERRPLEQFPELSGQTLLTGKFMTEFEDYALDQFPGRDGFRQLKSLFHYYVLGQKDNNDIILHNGYAAKLEYPLNETSVSGALGKFRTIYDTFLKDTGSRVFAAVVPDKCYYLQESGYLTMDYEKLFAMVREGMPYATHVDLTDALKLEDYYRTDTHWRQERILGAAERLCKALGVTVPQIGEYTISPVERPFYGVYYGQAALPMKPETMYLLKNQLLENCVVTNHETGKTGQIYDMEKLTSRDLYDVFLSGAVALQTIENPNASTDRELIVFRDSFGSSMIPLLIGDYARITVADIRYVASSLLDQLVDFHGQDVLFLYSTSVLNNSSTLK